MDPTPSDLKNQMMERLRAQCKSNHKAPKLLDQIMDRLQARWVWDLKVAKLNNQIIGAQTLLDIKAHQN